jgi:ATP-binding cassette subfamily B protein
MAAMKSIDLLKPYFVEKRIPVFFGVACLIAVDFLQLCIPRVIKWTIDDLTTFRTDVPGLLRYALYLVVIAVCIGLMRYIWRSCLIGTSRRIEEGLRNQLFSHIQALSASFFDRTKTGDLMARSTNDLQHVRMAVGMGVVALTDAIILGAAAVGFMAYISIRLTVFALIPMPFIVFGAKFFSKKMHRRYQDVQGAFSDLTEVVRERFAGIRVIKTYNRQGAEIETVKSVSSEYVDKNLGLVRITGSFFPMMLFFSNLSIAVVLYLGGRLAIDFTITPGDFVAFIAYLGLLTWPMMAMGWVVNLIQRGRASLDRINIILQTRPDIENLPGAMPAHRVSGEIVFENVTFSYPDNAKQSSMPPVLTGIDIQLNPGRYLGIVGPPGSGKTTFLSLIPRLFEVSGGRILFDGRDIRTFDLQALRSTISFVPQEPFLFAGTIRENITFGDGDIKDSELNTAVKKAALLNTIDAFPAGFETIVGEKGVMLSGGQKQRIALARAFLLKKPIVILDDPISQVDMETGDHIVNAIRAMAGSCTVIIVSHRLTAVRHADHIIALSRGRIRESGTHRDLMKLSGYYAKTCRLQEVAEEHRVH